MDLSKLPGYRDDMSDEEKLALLLDYLAKNSTQKGDDDADNSTQPDEKKTDTTSLPTPKPVKKTVPKRLFDDQSSEIAKLKKQLRAKQTDEEAKAAELEEVRAREQAELEQLRKERTLGNYNAKFLGLGYDPLLAQEVAEALSENDMDAVFAAMQKHDSAREKTLRATILKETPIPPAGDPSKANLSVEEELHNQLYGN
jgi:septal ring factor EnvC (AmiA/AmiB activator)